MAKATTSSSENKELKMEKSGFAAMNEDLLHNVLSRLPASTFASAACVSKYWNQICHRILSRPKIASALSCNPSLHVAAQEVLDDVLSKPIQPHFAIASISSGFALKETLEIIVKRLGSKIPVIVSLSNGIMGRDVCTNKFREVKWNFYSDLSDEEDEETEVSNRGIVLTIGFFPDVKVDAIPLSRPKRARQGSTIDNFVTDVREYTASVSNGTSPLGIIIFGDQHIDMNLIMEKLDYAMSKETFIIGDERCRFLYRSRDGSTNVCRCECSTDAIALVFARDRSASHDTGKSHFHVAVSSGIRSIGPKFKAVSVKEKSRDHVTWLTARRDGQQEVLDGESIMDHIDNELEDDVDGLDLYIGVTRRRKCSIGKEKTKIITSLAFYGVVGGDNEYLYTEGIGIRTGDYFQFYCPDSNSAVSSCTHISMNLQKLKLDCNTRKECHRRELANSVGKEVIGGFIFSCCGRGESFFGQSNVDSYPFLESFPGVSLAGIFSGGEIGRCDSVQGAQDVSSVHRFLHIYSAVYLVVLHSSLPVGH